MDHDEVYALGWSGSKPSGSGADIRRVRLEQLGLIIVPNARHPIELLETVLFQSKDMNNEFFVFMEHMCTSTLIDFYRIAKILLPAIPEESGGLANTYQWLAWIRQREPRLPRYSASEEAHFKGKVYQVWPIKIPTIEKRAELVPTIVQSFIGGLEKLVRRQATKVGNGMARSLDDVRADDVWGNMFYLPDDLKADAALLILQVMLLDWLKLATTVIPTHLGKWQDFLKENVPYGSDPVLSVIYRLNIRIDADMSQRGGYSKSTFEAIMAMSHLFPQPPMLDFDDEGRPFHCELPRLWYSPVVTRITAQVIAMLREELMLNNGLQPRDVLQSMCWALTADSKFLLGHPARRNGQVDSEGGSEREYDRHRPPLPSDHAGNSIKMIDAVRLALHDIVQMPAAYNYISFMLEYLDALPELRDKFRAAQVILQQSVLNWFGIAPIPWTADGPSKVAEVQRAEYVSDDDEDEYDYRDEDTFDPKSLSDDEDEDGFRHGEEHSRHSGESDESVESAQWDDESVESVDASVDASVGGAPLDDAASQQSLPASSVAASINRAPSPSPGPEPTQAPFASHAERLGLSHFNTNTWMGNRIARIERRPRDMSATSSDNGEDVEVEVLERQELVVHTSSMNRTFRFIQPQPDDPPNLAYRVVYGRQANGDRTFMDLYTDPDTVEDPTEPDENPAYQNLLTYFPQRIDAAGNLEQVPEGNGDGGDADDSDDNDDGNAPQGDNDDALDNTYQTVLSPIPGSRQFPMEIYGQTYFDLYYHRLRPNQVNLEPHDVMTRNNIQDREAYLHGVGPYNYVAAHHEHDDIQLGPDLIDGRRASGRVDGIFPRTLVLQTIGVTNRPGHPASTPYTIADAGAQQQIIRALRSTFPDSPPLLRRLRAEAAPYAANAVVKAIYYQHGPHTASPLARTPEAYEFMEHIRAVDILTKAWLEAQGESCFEPPQPVPYLARSLDIEDGTLCLAVAHFGFTHGIDLRLGILRDNQLPVCGNGHYGPVGPVSAPHEEGTMDTISPDRASQLSATAPDSPPPVTSATRFVWIYHDVNLRQTVNATHQQISSYIPLKPVDSLVGNGRRSHYLLGIRQEVFRTWQI